MLSEPRISRKHYFQIESSLLKEIALVQIKLNCNRLSNFDLNPTAILFAASDLH